VNTKHWLEELRVTMGSNQFARRKKLAPKPKKLSGGGKIKQTNSEAWKKHIIHLRGRK